MTLKIGNQRFNNYKISTKIHFGKRQFVWELSDQNSPMKNDNEESKSACKKKFEIRFSDIERIDINTELNTLTIGMLIFRRLL